MSLKYSPASSPDNPTTRPCSSAGRTITRGAERHRLITLNRLATRQQGPSDQIISLGAQLTAQRGLSERRHRNSEQYSQHGDGDHQLDQGKAALMTHRQAGAPNLHNV